MSIEATVNDTVNYKDEVAWDSADKTVAEVDSNGKVTPKKVGKTVITASITSKDGKQTRTVLFPLEVLTQYDADQLAGGEDGLKVSFKYASPEVKAQILAALERHLINKGASIPVIITVAPLFIPARDIAHQGICPDYGLWRFVCEEVTDNDVKHPYRTYTTADPKTFNHLMYKDSIESDMMSLTELSLFSLEFVDTDEDGFFDGYAMRRFRGGKIRRAVQYNEETGEWEVVTDFDPDNDAFTAWKVTLRQDLFWTDKKGKRQSNQSRQLHLYV